MTDTYVATLGCLPYSSLVAARSQAWHRAGVVLAWWLSTTSSGLISRGSGH